MSKAFKQILTEMIGADLESRGFAFAPVKSNRGYPIYQRKSDSYIEIIQFGKDRYEPKLTVACSIVYLGVGEEKSNIHYPSFREYSGGNFAEICVDDCKDKFFLKGHFGRYFYFGDVYLALGKGIVGVSEGAKKPFGVKIRTCTPETYETVAKRIAKRLDSAYAWLAMKKRQKT